MLHFIFNNFLGIEGRMRLNYLLLVMMFLVLFPPISYSAENDSSNTFSLPVVRIGVLAHRPKSQTLHQWRPLGELLKIKVPGYDFVIEALTYSELNEAVQTNQVDFILTNSSHFVTLKNQTGLSSPIATLAVDESGHKATHYGGVIFTRSDRHDIQNFQDIKHKRIAITNTFSLGGYQMQAYELSLAQVYLPKDATLMPIGLPHDHVIEMVMSGRADVGFVRTGILEEMHRERKIELSNFKILAPLDVEPFPVKLSTKLYPEWPLAAMPHIDETLARNVVAALFKLEENSPLARLMGIYGFNIPANYRPLENMLRTMYFPPFDQTPSLSLKDLWSSYSSFIIFFILLTLTILINGLFYMWRTNLKLKESQYLYEKLSNHTKTMHWEVTAQGLYTYVSDNIRTLLGYEPKEVINTLYFYDLCPAEERESFKQKIYSRFEAKGEYYHHERRILKKNGDIAWVSVYGFPILDKDGYLKGYRGSNTDITERKLALDALTESKARFKALHDASFGGMVIHEQGIILTCNPSFAHMCGYTIEELLGTNILLCIAPETREIVSNMMRQKYEKPYEALCIRKDKSTFIARIEAKEIVYQGKNVRFVEYRDITEDKKAQEKLQLAASVFETAREAILITDAKEVIIEVNDSFCRISGYDRDDVIGKTPRILSSGHHSKEFYQQMWESVITKGHWYGEVHNRRKNGEIYIELVTITALRNANHEIQHFIALFSDITLLKQHEHQLEFIAHHDALTNLPNRLLLADRLHQGMIQAKRRGQSLVVTYLDLDGFKTINDLYGHEIGDQLLIALSKQMKQTLREGDTLARMGGDEFVAVFQDMPDVETTLPLLHRLLNAASMEVVIEGLTLNVSASLGVTFYPQAEELEADQLLRQADQAMYQAKLAGKNRYHIFDSVHDKSMRDYHENIELIRLALEKNEFILYYQPKVNMKTGTLVGVEALIRWNHPEHGILPPSSFLPAIENHPLSVDVGKWVIQTALLQIETWQDEGLEIAISVNVGARQLQESSFVSDLRELLLEHSRVNPALLSLEILETSALDDLAHISKLMKECLHLGVGFAMDDFGTGYSSLTYLKQLPINFLKIDQSFVRDMLDDANDLSILKGIIGLATAFNTDIIAEGVETIEHGEVLLQLGCELAQGYGIARPMPPSQIPQWLTSWKPHPTWLDALAVKSEQFQFLLAIVEHREWMRAVEHFVLGKLIAMPNLNDNECNFGLWLKNKELLQYGKIHINTLKRIHTDIHLMAAKLCTQFQKGDVEQAQAGLSPLRDKSNVMCDILKKLSQSKYKKHTLKE